MLEKFIKKVIIDDNNTINKDKISSVQRTIQNCNNMDLMNYIKKIIAKYDLVEDKTIFEHNLITLVQTALESDNPIDELSKLNGSFCLINNLPKSMKSFLNGVNGDTNNKMYQFFKKEYESAVGGNNLEKLKELSGNLLATNPDILKEKLVSFLESVGGDTNNKMYKLLFKSFEAAVDGNDVNVLKKISGALLMLASISNVNDVLNKFMAKNDGTIPDFPPLSKYATLSQSLREKYNKSLDGDIQDLLKLIKFITMLSKEVEDVDKLIEETDKIMSEITFACKNLITEYPREKYGIDNFNHFAETLSNLLIVNNPIIVEIKEKLREIHSRTVVVDEDILKNIYMINTSLTTEIVEIREKLILMIKELNYPGRSMASIKRMRNEKLLHYREVDGKFNIKDYKRLPLSKVFDVAKYSKEEFMKEERKVYPNNSSGEKKEDTCHDDNEYQCIDFGSLVYYVTKLGQLGGKKYDFVAKLLIGIMGGNSKAIGVNGVQDASNILMHLYETEGDNPLTFDNLRKNKHLGYAGKSNYDAKYNIEHAMRNSNCFYNSKPIPTKEDEIIFCDFDGPFHVKFYRILICLIYGIYKQYLNYNMGAYYNNRTMAFNWTAKGIYIYKI